MQNVFNAYIWKCIFYSGYNTPPDISPFIKALLKPLMKMYKLAQGL